MNIKCLCYVAISTLALILASASINAQEKPTLTTAQIKENCKACVKTFENGDVVVEFRPVSSELNKQAKDVSRDIFNLITHFDPNVNFEKFNKIMVQEAGTGGKSRSLADMLDATAQFLSSYNMKMRPVQYMPSNIKNRINSGLPYLLSITNNPELEDIEERSKKREDVKDMKEWGKILRKETIKNLSNAKFSTFALIRGYNKNTGEILITIGNKKLWMTDSEVKLFAYRMLEPRL